MKGFGAEDGVPTLAAALFDLLNADELKRLATLTAKRAPTRKDDLVEHILEHLAGDRLRAVWQGLDELQKAAVAEVVHSREREFPAARFKAKYGRLPDFGTLNRHPREGHVSPLRLFFIGGGNVMPDDLRERLAAFVPPPAEATVTSVEALPAVYEKPCSQGTEAPPFFVRETERTASRELLSVLRLVDSGKVSVSVTTRRPSTAAVTAVTAGLDGSDFYPFQPPRNSRADENAGPIRAFAWPLLVQAGGLAQLSGSKLQLTKAGRKALTDPVAQTLKTLWAKWRGSTLVDELSRIDFVKGQTGKAKRSLTAVSFRREAIAASVGKCPVGRWVGVDELARFQKASGNAFSVSRNPWGLYLGDPHYGSFGYEGSSAFLDHRYLLCFLFEYAATLGLVDVAFVPPAGARSDYGELWGADDLPFLSRYDGLQFIRLNALGAFCLGVENVYESAPRDVKPVLRVLPNLDVVAIDAGLEPCDRIALDSYAVRTSDAVWKLERGKLLSAAGEGRSVAELRELLAAGSGAQLPQTVVRLLEDVEERLARVRDGGLARLVECDEPALAALLANDSRTRRHCMRAGERHLAVPASSEAAFRRGLREAGYLVALAKPSVAAGGRKATKTAKVEEAADAPGAQPEEP